MKTRTPWLLEVRLIASAVALALFSYLPIKGDDPWTVTGIKSDIQRDVVYGHKDGLALTMDVFQPVESPNGMAIISILSGGWFSKWDPKFAHDWGAARYIHAGFTVFAVRHGSSPKYDMEEIVGDIKLSVRFLRQNADRFEIDPDKIAITGISSGGHLALVIGTSGDDGDPDAENEVMRYSSRVGAVAALVPPTDLTVTVWASPESKPFHRSMPALDLSIEEAKQVSPVSLVTSDDAPVMIYMAEKDESVPPIHGLWMKKALEEYGIPCRHYVIPNAAHWPGTENFKEFQLDAVEWFIEHMNMP